jgi:hypothetical protein
MAKSVRKNWAKLVDKITGPMSEKTVTEVMVIGGMYADLITPNALGNLLRSRFREVVKSGNGYTAAYAAAVHGAKGTLKGTNTPRPTPGTGNYWDPDAEPEFLTKGFERDGLDAIKKAIIKGMSV